MQRPSGPVGHCSAKLRRILEIEEEAALGNTVRIKDVARDQGKSAGGGGNRWTREPNFAVPGPFHFRPVTANGSVSFHFSITTVSKSVDGGSVITKSDGKKSVTSKSAGDHSKYIAREGAVEAIDAAAYAAYANRDGAIEMGGGLVPAHFTNIHPDAKVREGYWKAVHACERTAGTDQLVLHPDRLPRTAWQRIATAGGLSDAVREIAVAFASPPVGARPDRVPSRGVASSMRARRSPAWAGLITRPFLAA